MDELQAIKTHLANLARNKPTARRRAEVEALLVHKWTGVQVQAANVLAAWGGSESVSALRRWQGDGRPSPLALKLLGRCVGDDDVDWALDLYFRNYADPRERIGVAFFPLIVGLPRAPTLARLHEESKPGSRNRKAANIAVRWLTQRDQWLRDHADSIGRHR